MNPRKLTLLVHRSMAVLNAAGYSCSPTNLGGFDLVAISSTDLVLCKVCQGKPPWAGAIADLQAVPGPGNCRKLIHVWSKRNRLPDVTEI